MNRRQFLQRGAMAIAAAAVAPAAALALPEKWEGIAGPKPEKYFISADPAFGDDCSVVGVAVSFDGLLDYSASGDWNKYVYRGITFSELRKPNLMYPRGIDPKSANR